MLTKKINAVLSLIITVLIFAHAVSMALCMLSMGKIDRIPEPMSWALSGLVLLHAFICIYSAVAAHSGGEHKKSKSYPKLNRATNIQRISGLLMVVFTGLHVAGAAGFMTPPRIVHAIVPPIFFAIVMAHVAVSTSKAFISLGIGNARFVKRADVFVKVFSVLTLVADIVGFFLFVW